MRLSRSSDFSDGSRGLKGPRVVILVTERLATNIVHMEWGLNAPACLLDRPLYTSNSRSALKARCAVQGWGAGVAHHGFAVDLRSGWGRAPRVRGSRLNRLRGRSPAMLCGTLGRATRARSVRRCKRNACEYCRKIREMST